jgi:glycosyltransferase involved in cell wall biosynthesis
MKILLSAYSCDPGRGSESANGWNWAWHLAKAGHEVWVLTGEPKGDQQRRLERARDLNNLHIIEVWIPLLGGMLGRVLRKSTLGGILRYWRWLRRSYKVAKTLAETQRFDLVHHVTWGTIIFGCPLWRLGLPFVYGPFGGGQVAPRSLKRYFGRHWKAERRRSLTRSAIRINPLARGVVKHATALFVTNSATERMARNLGGRRVYLVPDSAVPPELLDGSGRRKACTNEISILWLARLHPIKGLPLALDALARIPPDVKWRCTIVGDGPQSVDVHSWLKQFGVADRTKWVGAVPWSEIRRPYERADAFLFTSLRESLGIQLYEAAALALPIIALDHHGVADLIPDDVAMKVPVGKPEQTAQGLAQAIESLAKDPERRRAMGEAALQLAYRNTWPTRISNLYSIIEPLLQKSR